MAYMMNNIGLDYFEEDKERRMEFTAFLAHDGKEVPGYSNAFYLFTDTGSCEFWTHVRENHEKNRLEFAGIHTHGGNGCIWKMRHTGIDLSPDCSSVREHIGMLTDQDGSIGMIPVDIINADVLPSYMEGDIITVQVVGYPLDINYYENEEDYITNSRVIEGETIKWIQPIGTMLPLAYFDERYATSEFKSDVYSPVHYVSFAARVKSFQKGIFRSRGFEKTTYIRCNIETGFGSFELAHSLEQVPEIQRVNMRAGAIVSGTCLISGDVALDEYTNGAVKDHERVLRLIRYALSEKKIEKIAGVLNEKSVYISESSHEKFFGKEAIMQRMKRVQESLQEDRKPRVDLAVITKTDSNASMYSVGTRCLALKYGGESIYEAVIFITLNAEGIIEDMRVSTDQSYHFSTFKPKKTGSILDGFRIPEDVEEAIITRAELNHFLEPNTDVDVFFRETGNTQDQLDLAIHLLNEINKKDYDNLISVRENSFGYSFASAAETAYNEFASKRIMAVGLNTDDELNTIIDPIEDEKLYEMLSKGVKEGKKYYSDFRNYINPFNKKFSMGELYLRAVVIVQKLGYLYGKRIWEGWLN